MCEEDLQVSLFYTHQAQRKNASKVRSVKNKGELEIHVHRSVEYGASQEDDAVEESALINTFH